MSDHVPTRRPVDARKRVISARFHPPIERRSALDPAHRGDILGALGRIATWDVAPAQPTRRRLAMLAAILGPGIIVMTADNDAGGVSVYAQAGQNYGLRLVWALPVLAVMLFVTQEMVARLGAVTGAGHARLIFERFGRLWGTFAVGDLLILNLLTLVTEFIGVRLAMSYFGLSAWLSVPIAVVALIAATFGGSYRRWERTMYVLALATIAEVGLAIATHPSAGSIASAFVPTSSRPLGVGGVAFVLAVVGTTVAPWQLFFLQSNVVDKRVTPRWMTYQRLDVLVGTILFAVGSISIIVACAAAYQGSSLHGEFQNAGTVAAGVAARFGRPTADAFALLLLDASILGACVVTLSTSYAVGDAFGYKHSLHRSWRDARVFHGTYAVMVILAGAVVLMPGISLGFVTTLIQMLGGVLWPSALVFLLILCNDADVLGPHVNPRWLNAIATVVVAVLLALSGLVIATTLLPSLNLAVVSAGAAAATVAALAVVAVQNRRSTSSPGRRKATAWERATWTMPPLESLEPPPRSRLRATGLIVLRGYLGVVVILLGVYAFARI